jgi:hypothetical protein
LPCEHSDHILKFHFLFSRLLGLCPQAHEQRARASFILRALCKPHDASASPLDHPTSSLPLFGFDPDSEADPATINFAEKGAWAHDAKGAFSIKRHVQALHMRASNLARMDVSQEPAVAQHALKLKTWREALGVTHDPAPPEAAVCKFQPGQDDCAAVSVLFAAAAIEPPPPSLPSNSHAFLFKCWPSMCDCESSVVRLT